MADFNLNRERLQEVAERLAGMWEVTYYHRELRPKVKETLEELKKRGYHLGVISNTASLYSVFDVLEQYGIRDYFEDVTPVSYTHLDVYKRQELLQIQKVKEPDQGGCHQPV